MNSPWTPTRGATPGRDLFAAFVCDDLASELIRTTCLELGWPIHRINKGGLRNAVQTLSVSASPSILFVDMSDSTDALRDINALAEVCEPGTIVISGGQVNDVRLYRDLLASGIQDYLLKPFSPDQMRDVLAHAQALLAAPKLDDGPQRPHVQITVVGARGGCGASSVATALAWSIAEQEGRSAALLDLDVHFGTTSLSLDLEPGHGLKDAVENPSRIDGLFLERAMVKVTEKLSILSAESSINEPVIPDGSAFRLLQDEVKMTFEFTVTDTPRDLLVYHPSLLHGTQVLLIVADQSLACARDVYRMLGWVKAVAPSTQVLVVLNKVPSGANGEISRKDFETSIECKVDFSLPEDVKTASHSAKLGKALTDAGKGSRLADALHSLASQVIAQGAIEPSDTKALATLSNKGSLINKITELGLKIRNRKTYNNAAR